MSFGTFSLDELEHEPMGLSTGSSIPTSIGSSSRPMSATELSATESMVSCSSDDCRFAVDVEQSPASFSSAAGIENACTSTTFLKSEETFSAKSHSAADSDSSSSSRISLAQFELPIFASDPNGRLFEIRKFCISLARCFEKPGFTMDLGAISRPNSAPGLNVSEQCPLCQRRLATVYLWMYRYGIQGTRCIVVAFRMHCLINMHLSVNGQNANRVGIPVMPLATGRSMRLIACLSGADAGMDDRHRSKFLAKPRNFGLFLDLASRIEIYDVAGHRRQVVRDTVTDLFAVSGQTVFTPLDLSFGATLDGFMLCTLQ
uniref:Uncharacterized protein n=1 Tax=Anopheles farauti TaxID=69004 RepID=A0A182Q4P0_9DIPT